MLIADADGARAPTLPCYAGTAPVYAIKYILRIFRNVTSTRARERRSSVCAQDTPRRLLFFYVIYERRWVRHGCSMLAARVIDQEDYFDKDYDDVYVVTDTRKDRYADMHMRV